jgi:hypothetical protein
VEKGDTETVALQLQFRHYLPLGSGLLISPLRDRASRDILESHLNQKWNPFSMIGRGFHSGDHTSIQYESIFAH